MFTQYVDRGEKQGFRRIALDPFLNPDEDFSSPLSQSGLSWRLSAKRFFPDMYISLHCVPDKESPKYKKLLPGWSCAVRCEFFVDLLCIKPQFIGHTCTFNEKHETETVSMDMMRFQCEFVLGRIEKVNIEVNWFYQVTVPWSFDHPITSELSDVTIIVGGHKIMANKLVLALHSRYFQALFYGSFMESGLSEIDISDVEYDEFVVFLRMLYPNHNLSVDGNNVHRLLEYSDRFDVPALKQECSSYLRQSGAITLSEKLLYGERYRLLALRSECLRAVEELSVQALQQLATSDEFPYLSVISRCVVMERLIPISTKRRFLLFGENREKQTAEEKLLAELICTPADEQKWRRRTERANLSMRRHSYHSAQHPSFTPQGTANTPGKTETPKTPKTARNCIAQ